jgi:ribonuclease HII
VDEAGRGPLCGPVVAAAVILDPARPIDGLNDSKKLSELARERLAPLIRERALAWAVGEASVEEIDRLNILQATMLAMQRAVAAIGIAPEEVLIDGNRCPVLPYPSRAIVKGDATEPAISAASILAKTTRDQTMRALDRDYPQYGLAAHKGYPTAAHLAAIREHGLADFYRRSFAPVRKLLESR